MILDLEYNKETLKALKEKATALSPILVADLKTAIEHADIDEIYILVEQIHLEEPILADVLSKLVDNFDYKKVEQIMFAT